MTRPDPRQLLNALLQQLQAAVTRCAVGPHTESVHQVRVAARRLRAMLRCLRTELHPMTYDQLRFDLTNLSRMLGEVRAADIRLQLMTLLLRQCAQPTSKERSDLRALATHARRKAEETLQRGMQEASWHQRIQRLADALAQDELLLVPAGASNEGYRALLHPILRRTSHALRTRHHNVDVLHQQRIHIKNARYVCELLPQVDLDLRKAVAALDKGQDLLGEFHDLHALRAWLDSMAGDPLNERLTRLAAKRARRDLRRFHRCQPKLRRRLQDAARALRHNLQ